MNSFKTPFFAIGKKKCRNISGPVMDPGIFISRAH